MGINRVDFGGRTLIDISNSNVNPDALCVDHMVYGADGEPVIGANPYEKAATDETVGSQASLLDQALAAIANKAAGGGSGGSDGFPGSFATGTFIPETEITATKQYYIEHGLGVRPNFLVWFITEDSPVKPTTSIAQFGAVMRKTADPYNFFHMITGLNSSGAYTGIQGRVTGEEGLVSDDYIDDTRITMLSNQTMPLQAGVKYRWVCGVLNDVL